MYVSRCFSEGKHIVAIHLLLSSQVTVLESQHNASFLDSFYLMSVMLNASKTLTVKGNTVCRQQQNVRKTRGVVCALLNNTP